MTRTPWSPRSSDAAPRGKVRIVRIVHKAAAATLSASPAVPSQRPRARPPCAPARAMGRSNRNVCRCCDDVGVSARSLHSVTVMPRTWTKNGLELRQTFFLRGFARLFSAHDPRYGPCDTPAPVGYRNLGPSPKCRPRTLTVWRDG